MALHSQPSLVWCCFPLLGGVAFLSLPLGGAALSMLLLWRGGACTTSPFGVVLLGLLLLMVLLFPLSFLRVLPFFPSSWLGCSSLLLGAIFPRNQRDPEEEEGSTTKRRRPSRSIRKGRQRKATPLKGRRRDHHSTELNLTSVEPTNLNSALTFVIFFWESGATQQGRGGKASTQRERRKAPPPKRRGELLLPPPFGRWSLPYRSDPLLLLVVLPPSVSFGWCFLPLPSLGGAAVLLCSMKVKDIK